MSRLPKLKVKTLPGDSNEEIRDVEQAKDFPFLLFDSLILVEGQTVTSYDELLQIAKQDSYQDRKFLNVMILNYSLPDGG